MENLYWKFHGIFEDIYYYVTALPRFILFWGEKSPLNLYTFVKWNIKKYPNEKAFLFKDEVLTWKQASDKIDCYSGVIRSLGLNKGDSFALLMDNRIEYLLLILAAVKSGTIAALLNTTVKGEGLKHVLNVANAKAIFIGASHLEKFNSSLTEEERQNLIVVGIDDQEQVPSDIQNFTNLEKDSIACDEVTTSFKEACMYMYTSGTTGLPKAALITNERAVRMTYFGQFLGFNFKQSDILYNTLPLYHATGLLYCWAASLRAGNAIVIKEKFSASDFWSDIQKYEATIFPYVGELCRYLLNSKEVPEEKGHKIRRISGNGLRPDIWEKFQERFQIPEIREIYGATEGVTGFINRAGRPGMIGRHRSADKIVKCDLESGEIIRNTEGLCEKVNIGETGLYISEISKLASFDGYLDSQASQKKILTDCFKDGDRYFNSGDLLTLHENNWLSFADRVGDTFRWKGENVSTMEVAAIVNKAEGVLDANVYGVQVDNTEGRAGMAQMNVSDSFNLNSFADHVEKNLNGFQKPYFLRLTKEMQTTGTFKHQKEDLKKLGFDPTKSQDPVYFLNGDKYEEINEELYKGIQSGNVRF